MVITRSEQQTPLVLIASGEELSADTLERSLNAERFRTVRSPPTVALFERGGTLEPDAIILELDLPDVRRGGDICRALVQQQWMDPMTPVLVIVGCPMSPEDRIRLLRAGAWDVMERPVDPREVVLRLHRYLIAKQESGRAHSLQLLDPETGLYNARGLQRRVEELAADAYRRHAALACLAILPRVTESEAPAEPEYRTFVVHMQRLLRSIRRSDVVGRGGDMEFLVVAPRTTADGAVGLARRLLRHNAAVAQQTGEAPLPLRVGYEAVPNMQEGPADPKVLLADAIEAARRIPAGGAAQPIHVFRSFEHRRPPEATT